MAKDLRSFIAECERQLPGEVIHITKEVNPANYDVTAIIKHLGAQKKFPVIILRQSVESQCKVGPIKLTMNCEISQGKTQIALDCLNMRPGRRWQSDVWRWKSTALPPTIVAKKDAPVKEKSNGGKGRRPLPDSRHAPPRNGRRPIHCFVDGDERQKVGIYNCSYHRME